MKIRDFLPQQVITATADSGVHAIAAKMRTYGVGFIPILEGGELVGAVTDRDLVVRALALTDALVGVRARDVMSRHPITVADDAEPEDAAVLMRKHKVHRLIVTRSNGTVCGVVSLTDLSLLSEEAFEVLKRLSEKPLAEAYPEEDVNLSQLLAP